MSERERGRHSSTGAGGRNGPERSELSIKVASDEMLFLGKIYNLNLNQPYLTSLPPLS